MNSGESEIKCFLLPAFHVTLSLLFFSLFEIFVISGLYPERFIFMIVCKFILTFSLYFYREISAI